MMPVVLDGSGKLRVTPPARLGGPNAPVNPNAVRVSATRHGVMATKTKEFVGVCAYVTGPRGRCKNLSDISAASASAGLGCQYKGAGS